MKNYVVQWRTPEQIGKIGFLLSLRQYECASPDEAIGRTSRTINNPLAFNFSATEIVGKTFDWTNGTLEEQPNIEDIPEVLNVR